MSKNLTDILKNKNCFITGATGGIGRRITRKMAESGCNLFLTSLEEDKLKELKNELSAGQVFYEPGDFNKLEDIERIIKKTTDALGSVDILIHCAGVFEPKLLENIDLRDMENHFNVNVRASLLFSKAFSPFMVRNKWGRIVNIGSSSAYKGGKESIIYCMTKHAILGLSRAFHDELKEHNVRTFCVSPAAVKTPMGGRIKKQDYNTFIDPEDIAEYIAFVISFGGDMVVDEVRLNRMIMQ